MLVLLPLLWLLSAWARDTSPPRDSAYTVRAVSSCPAVGYFFKRESAPNALGQRCYLCFCQEDGTAICWQRANKRCDVSHYRHGIGKRETRVRRSPFPGFSDIFFRDATRDIFNKQTPQTCKPYETSFSEGCPPDDWCTGCTVCDCDAHGRWDCHVLSFCPDKKNGTKMKTKAPLRSGPPKKTTVKPSKTTAKSKKTTAKPAPRPTRRTTKKPPVNNNPKQIKNTGKAQPNKNIQRKNNGSPKPLIKRVVQPSKKKVLQRNNNNTQVLLNPNETAKITQEVYKKVASAVQKMISNKISASMKEMKNMQKRSLGKKTQPCVKNSKNAKKNVRGKFKPNKKQYKNSRKPSKKAKPKKFISSTKKPKPNSTGQHKKVKRQSQPLRFNPNRATNRNWRMKREILVTENNTTPLSNSETTLNVLPIMTTTEKMINNTDSVTYNYYKYSVVTPEPFTNATKGDIVDVKYTYGTQENSELYNNETNNEKVNVRYPNGIIENSELNIANETKSEIVDVKYTNGRIENSTEENNLTLLEVKKYEENKTNILTLQQNVSNIELVNKTIKLDHNITMDKIPEYNDLKFKDWSQLKLLKNNYLVQRLLSLNNSLNFVNASRNGYNTLIVTPKTHTRDVQRLVTPAVRRYNKSRLVSTISCNTKNRDYSNHASSFKERIYNKIDGLHNVMKNLLKELRKDNAVKVKPKRFNIIRYLRKFFRKIFKKRNGKGFVDVNKKGSFNRHIIDTICVNFGDCDMANVNRIVLNKKIKELYAESFNVLKSVNIIKGLLRLLDLPQDTTLAELQNSNITDQKINVNGDIQKLNAILNDRYLTSDHKFTETELTQMKYVKKNTQSFIQSVGRFASKLNEIIFILTKQSSNTKRNLVVREAKINQVKKQGKETNVNKKITVAKKNNDKKIINVTKKNNEKNGLNVTNENNDTMTHQELVKDYVNKLKYMLEKYTLIQGALLQSMHQSLRKFQSIGDDKSKEDMIDKNKHASRKIVRMSSNIINNLKKLKAFAAAMSAKQRTKRDTLRDDDAMEYLLTLMEYLLKQNHPLDTAPVNDGIDLLIEAIKTAPDIKPIKKKVLQAVPIHTNVVLTTRKPTTNKPPIKVSKEDNSLDSNKISKEDSLSNAKDETNEQAYQEKNDEPPGKIIFEDANTQSVYYNKDTQNYEANEFTTAAPTGTTEHNNFDKLEKALDDSVTEIDGKKIEVFIGDVEDDDTHDEVTSTTAATEVQEETDATTVTVPEVTTEMNLLQVKDRQKINSLDTSGSNDSVQKHVPLDWLEDGEEQPDTREVKPSQNATTKAQARDTTTKPVTSPKMRLHLDNISAITKEINDDDSRQDKSSKQNIEEVMLKKQMDLLNSLDYGTERSDTDEGESKDGDERYAGDAFPAYFV